MTVCSPDFGEFWEIFVCFSAVDSLLLVRLHPKNTDQIVQNEAK